MLTILLTLVTTCGALSPHRPLYDDYTVKQYTRNITLKQGVLQGIVVEPKVNRALPMTEQYRGIPYAAAPVGELRFMPSGSAPSWFGVKFADTYGPVCPQKFPDEKRMTAERRAAFLRLKQYLQNQSEDCLYLNIYAPYQGEFLRPFSSFLFPGDFTATEFFVSTFKLNSAHQTRVPVIESLP